MGSENEGLFELIWGGGFKRLGGVGKPHGSRGKERKWKTRKVKVSWSQFVK